jgi:17beta-estradiol 17-dehydrogenase/3alpha(17beta)-hydroxysteroid dehydrogenase (NAD+)
MASAGILGGRLAVITGGGSGIGRAICQAFAAQGARVAVADINHQNALETAGKIQGAQAFQVDVSSAESVSQLFTSAQEKFSECPSYVVNSAGITRDTLLLKMTEEAFDQVIGVNLKGTFLVTQTVARMMVKDKIQGSIINFASVVGKHGNVGQANYTASKAGVEGFTRTAAKELGRYGIRVNAVLPGLIDTPMTQVIPDKVKGVMQSFIPLNRIGVPEEVAETCVFLASSKSSYITGASIDVTGGLAI